MKKEEVKCGDIFWCNAFQSTGHEYKKYRPYLVIDNNSFIRANNVICVLPLTTKLDKKHLDDILILKSATNGLKEDSVAKSAHIKTFDKNRLKSYLGTAENSVIKKIHFNLRKRFNF